MTWLAVSIALLAATAQAATPAVSAGEHFSLSLARDGTVRTWGDDTNGQLGVGRRLAASTPLAVNGLNGFTQVSAGSGFTLALRSDGTVWSWGQRTSLGYETAYAQSSPRRVPGLTGVIAVSA